MGVTNKFDKSARTLLRVEVFVFGAALGLRIAAALYTGGVWHPETFEYDGMAQSMVSGHGLVYTHLNVPYHSFAPPMYAWLSAASYWLFSSLAPLMALQIVAGSSLSLVAARIAVRLYPGWIAALAAGLFIAFHPGLVLYSAAKAHPLTFDALFFTVAVLQAIRLREQITVRRAIELGLIVGVGALCRATLVIILPMVAIWLLVFAWPKVLTVVRVLIIAGCCAAAIIAPWTIRSSLLHHRFVFMVTTDAENFWRGNNPDANGGTYLAEGKIVIDALPPAEMADLLHQPDEVAQADWFRARSHAFIRAHPGQFLRLTTIKLMRFWWMGAETGALYPRWWLIAYMSYYSLIVLCALIGAWIIWRGRGMARQHLFLIAAFLFALSFLQSLYYVEGRHRWAVEPCLIAVSGAGVALMARGRRRSELQGS
jgi:4-amino-4-deoxy-L-arabinose transferase-like glycosyltransferase